VELTPLRYPTQILEALLGFTILAALFLTDRLTGRENRPRGLLAALFLCLYFLGRFSIEFLKERQNLSDNLLLSRGQILSIIPFLLGAFLLVYVLKRPIRGAVNSDTVKSEKGKKSGAKKGLGSAIPVKPRKNKKGKK
jgi:prolipoprotein diacylglyceryltransferase